MTDAPDARRQAQSAQSADQPAEAGLSDEDLIALMARGEQAALSELHRRYAPYLYALGRRMLRDGPDAESCVQDAFLSVWRAAGRFDRTRASAKTWLVTIAHRRFLQWIRDRADATLPLEEWDAPTRAADPADALLAERAVGVLGSGERELVELAFYQGHSHSEVAELTGLPLGTVKTRLRAALLRMRRTLGGDEHGA